MCLPLAVLLRSSEFKLKSGINLAPYGLPPFILPRPRDLSSPPLRAEGWLYFAFDYCSLVPRSQKSKTKMGWKKYPNFLKIDYEEPAKRLRIFRMQPQCSPFTNGPPLQRFPNP
jgi:hypothetical protein